MSAALANHRLPPFALLAAALLAAGCSAPPKPEPTSMSPASSNAARDADPNAAAIAEWNAWHAERIRRLIAEDGWLTLIDLAYLEEGITTIGNGAASTLHYEHATAPRIGSFLRHGDSVTFACELAPNGDAAAAITADGRPVDRVELVADDKGEPTVLRDGPLSIILVRRNGQLALRVRDNASRVRVGFPGVDRFPYDPSLRVEARVERPAPGTTIAITNVKGFTAQEPLAATLVMTVGGHAVRLAATQESPDRLFVVFGDATNGSTSYGGGRFVDLAAPAGADTVIVDFNRAYNPPCSFTPFATCPVPTAGNRLTFPIEAGERAVPHPTHAP